MRDTSAAQGEGNHGEEAVCLCRDRSQPHHQTIEYGLLGIVVAVADADSPGMTPDACRQEQEPEPRSGPSSVAECFHRGLFFPVEQHQPAVEVVRQHGELEENAVHRPPARGMVRHAGIVFGFFNEILRTRPLVVEPREHGDPAAHIRDEYAVAVLRRVEQLILFGLLRRCRFLGLLVAQGDEAVGLTPAFRLIAELALAVGIGFGRTRPLGGFQFIDQTRGLPRRDNELYACLLVGRPLPRSKSRNRRARTSSPRPPARPQIRFPDDARSGHPSAGPHYATLRRYIPGFQPETLESAGSFSCLCSSGYTLSARPSDDRTRY